ncbi:MAG TPA: flagellar hook-associated protein FlgK [Stellaceae bacterium]|jgi:flagellar hook-associated protein FlgK|nr:flagellar hook-associated protein FlgK [Stellaceae bacterium]
MSIESALWTALSGLNATQAQIQVVSGNVANVQTPGYSREILPQETVVNAAQTSVKTGAVQRVVDQVLNSNLTNQTTIASAASTLATYYQQIDSLLGQVGSGATVNDALSKFSSALQAAATSPQDPVAQGAAVSAGQALAQTLNQLSAGIDSIRQGTDLAISTDVGTLNTALKSIATINTQISQLKAEGQSTAVLEDQRDQALNQVAQLIGVNSFITADGQMMVMTPTGQTLVDGVGAGTFSYTPSGNVSASTTLSGINLNGVDITNVLTSGSIGALRQLRDTDLPGLTAQLNQFTNNLFNATTVSDSGVGLAAGGGDPAQGDTFTATIDGVNYTTQGLPANPSMTDIANALNATLTAIDVPVTVNTPVAGDQFDVTIDGTSYTTAALSGTGPFTAADIASAIQAAIPSNFTATVNGGNIEIANTSAPLVSASIALHTGGTGTETFGTGVQATTFTASVAGGNIALADSSGNPLTATLVTNPMFVAGAPNNGSTPTTIDFTQPSGSFNIGQTFDVVVDGTDLGTTTALPTGSATLAGVASAIQDLFTAKGVGFTASVVGGKLEIADPAGNPITASVTLNGGPGSETFTAGVPMSPLNTLNSGLGATNDAHHFFASVDIASGIDNAATIQVNPSLIANNALLLQGASGPDPSISQSLFANLGKNYTFAAAGAFTNSTTTTLGSYSSQIIGQAASTAASSKDNSTFQSQLQSQLASQAGAVSGVNIDEELSNLIQYQNAYSANAKVITVIQTLYQTLMQM